MNQKKVIIGALVGGLILFIWQFLSWSVLNIHGSMQSYTPKQDQILQYLNENLEEGFYYMPNTPPGQEHTNPMEAYIGKPWAQVFFHKSMSGNMGMNMFRGFLVNTVVVVLLIWLFSKMIILDFKSIVLTCLSVGIISYLVSNYTNSIWFETKTMGDLVDAIVGFGLVGVWLGWWLKK